MDIIKTDDLSRVRHLFLKLKNKNWLLLDSTYHVYSSDFSAISNLPFLNQPGANTQDPF